MTQKPHDPGRNVSEVVDDPRATGEAADEGRGHGDGREAAGPGAQGQAAREPGHQKAATAQRQADGWVAVIGHAASRSPRGGREKTKCACTAQPEKEMAPLRAVKTASVLGTKPW